MNPDLFANDTYPSAVGFASHLKLTVSNCNLLLGEEVSLSLLNRSVMDEPPQRPRLDPFTIRQDIFTGTEEACQRGIDYCSGF